MQVRPKPRLRLALGIIVDVDIGGCIKSATGSIDR